MPEHPDPTRPPIILQVDKLLFMSHVKELPTAEAREAELLLFRRKRNEAVQVRGQDT